jgi:hypothetical protein
MGITTSLILIAAGAIMRFAVTAQASGFSVHTVGVILMIVGIVGAILSIAFWASWGGFRAGRRDNTNKTTTYVERDRTVV